MGYRRSMECPLALVPTSSRQGLSAHAHHTRGEADASRFRRTGCTRADVDNRTTESTGRHHPPTHPRQAGSTHPPTHPSTVRGRPLSRPASSDSFGATNPILQRAIAPPVGCLPMPSRRPSNAQARESRLSTDRWRKRVPSSDVSMTPASSDCGRVDVIRERVPVNCLCNTTLAEDLCNQGHSVVA